MYDRIGTGHRNAANRTECFHTHDYKVETRTDIALLSLWKL